MQDRIAAGLQTLFERHRIVFWYDSDREMRDAYEAVELDGIEKIELAGNEFAVKHRILREEPKRKFLLYRFGPEPEQMLENWLLDVQLANGVFKTDQVAIWLTELGLGIAFEELVRTHEEFFRSGKRLEQLRRMMKPDDTHTSIRLKMLAVCSGADGGFDTVVESLMADYAAGRDDKLRLIDRSRLTQFLWSQFERHFAYRGDNPSIGDFVIELFKTCFALGVDEDARLGSEALVFFRRWKNNRQHGEVFEKLSRECADVLDIGKNLEGRDFRSLIELDYFEQIDRTIIRALAHEVHGQTASHADVVGWIRTRRQGHWYAAYRHLYEAIGIASEFRQAMSRTSFGMTSLAEGVERYAQTWFRLDQLYRKFVFHMQQSAQAGLMGPLAEQIENHYVNGFLLKLNDAWQSHVDAAQMWQAPPIKRQREFFDTKVQFFRRRDQKICVIVSDALRYEIGEELLGQVRSLDRYEAEIEPMLASLPSYTQLGMASLLPNRELQISGDGGVSVDGQSSQGSGNRQKILEAGCPGDRVVVMGADEFMALSGDEARTVFRDHDIVYLFQNRIDAIGDKMVSEMRVFEEVEDTLESLVNLLKKLTRANASKVLVTADHGFIYQHRPLEESDFSGAEVAGAEILYRQRRFVLGRGLKDDPGLRKFTTAVLGLKGDLEVAIPKSINRLRRQGSGSRFVHGGAALQEVVVPVLTIGKKRQSDVSAVEVEIAGASKRTITSSQFSVLFYQSMPSGEKVRGRKLTAGLYSQTGKLISDSHELAFDFQSENPREREMPVRFLLSKEADSFDGQEVILKLLEAHPGTNQFKEYRTARYTLRRSIIPDFDF